MNDFTSGQLTQAAGLASSAGLVDNPKNVTINTVENGYTVSLSGGKQEEGKPYRHSKLLVAKDNEEALKIASDFLAD